MNEWTNASRKPQYSYFEFQISHHLPAGTVHGAALDALRRGLVGRDELFTIDAALAPFGGLPAGPSPSTRVIDCSAWTGGTVAGAGDWRPC